jgi:hypothetical protein
MLLRVYEAAGFYEEALRVLECFHVKSNFVCCFERLVLWLFC